jgi:peptide/nickel transport system permease protein
MTLTFFIANVVPSDPVLLRLGPRAKPEQLAFWRHQYGLDLPLPVQYLHYLGGVMQGNLGESIISGRPILTDLKDYLPGTIELTFVSFLIIILIGIPAGIYASTHYGSVFDHVSDFLASAGMGLPVFWLALIMQLIFYRALSWLPLDSRIDMVLGAPPRITGLFILDSLLARDMPRLQSSLQHVILPALTLSLASVAGILRQVRANILDTLKSDYVRTARAKGAPERIVINHHVLRNSFLPVITMSGMLLINLLSGAFIIETIFNWPGIGWYAMRAIIVSDYNAIVSITLVLAVICTVINLLVDILYSVLDPRIRLT